MLIFRLNGIHMEYTAGISIKHSDNSSGVYNKLCHNTNQTVTH